MKWWRRMLATLGLSKDVRVNIKAPGVHVTIIGDPPLVKSVLDAVKADLEKNHRERLGRGASGARGGLTQSQIVLPSDLDEMDSPYAIPEHRTIPPDRPDSAATPTDDFKPTTSHDIRDTLPLASIADDEPDGEITAISQDPSIGMPRPVMLDPLSTELPPVAPTRPDSRAILDEPRRRSRGQAPPREES